MNLGGYNPADCASAYFHAAFHPDENISPYMTWKGVPQQQKRSLETSRFVAACRGEYSLLLSYATHWTNG